MDKMERAQTSVRGPNNRNSRSQMAGDAAMHESGIGPSRRFAVARQFGRFRGIADMVTLVAGSTLVANDPERLLAGPQRCPMGLVT
jgi:hypothetical protein